MLRYQGDGQRKGLLASGAKLAPVRRVSCPFDTSIRRKKNYIFKNYVEMKCPDICVMDTRLTRGG